MNIESLKIFLDIYKLGNITMAASKHYMTPPAIGKRISSLEKELGVVLFERSKGKNHIEITSSGFAFLDIAERIIMLYEQALELKKDSSKKFLTLACVRSSHDGIISNLILSLKNQFSNWCITIEDHHTDEIFSLVENRRVNLGIAQSISNHTNLVSELLYKEEYRVVMHQNKLFKYNSSIHPTQLPANNAIFQEFDLDFQKWFDSWWHPYSVKIRVNTTPTAEQYFSDNNDWMIVPLSSAENLEKRGFVSYSLQTQPPLHKIYLIYNNNYNSKNNILFIETIKNIFKNKTSV